MRKFPPICRDCENRKVGCHNECQTYLDAKREYDKQSAEKRQWEQRERKIDEVYIKKRIRVIERARRNGKKYGK